MRRLKYIITSCALALAVSLGLSIAWPSCSSAETVYTFTFNENLNQIESVSGSFSIPVSDFATALANTQFSILIGPTTIAALSMTEGPQSFGLSNVVDGYNLFFNMDGSDVPQVYYESAGWLVTAPIGCDTATTCQYGIQPGNTGLVDILIPGQNGPGFTQVTGTWVTTTESIATPLPSTWTVMLIALAGLGVVACRRQRENTAALSAARSKTLGSDFGETAPRGGFSVCISLIDAPGRRSAISITRLSRVGAAT